MTLSTSQRNIVVIGASAGGVQALEALFSALPGHLDAAFFVVLHIPAHTPSALHRILSRVTTMRVVPVLNDTPLQARTVYVATSDRHLMLDKKGVRVTRGPKECRVRPAVDVLFRSASSAFGSRVIGVVLSGTLDDGTAGLWAVKDQKGLAFVQEPSDALHSSMPESAIEHVDVDVVGSVEALAHAIAAAIGEQVSDDVSKPNSGHSVENGIALNGDGMAAGVMDLGTVSKYTCPDCHGVLVQIEEGSIVRFRCHTGHAFSLKSLVAEVNCAIDNGLWATLRAIEERVMLLRQIADLEEKSGFASNAARNRQQADNAELRLKPLRELVLDSEFFGHDPALQDGQ